MREDGVTLSRRALVGVVVAALVLGMAAKTLVFRDGSSGGSGSAARPAAQERPVGPEGVDDHGVPYGFARSRDGALAAAVHFVGLGELVVNASPEVAESALRTIAAETAEAAFVETQLAGFGDLRQALSRGEGVTRLRAGVVATKLEGYTRDRARVALWRVLVLSRDGMTSPGEQWGIVTYELVWEDGDWRVWSEDITAGPTPAATETRPDDPTSFEAALTGFDPYPETR